MVDVSRIEDFAEKFFYWAGQTIEKLAAAKKKKKSKSGKGSFIFPPNSSKVKDGKGHFPLSSPEQARAALSYAGHHDKHPWYKGTVEELRAAVRRAVKRKYPSIDVSDKKKSKKSS